MPRYSGYENEIPGLNRTKVDSDARASVCSWSDRLGCGTFTCWGLGEAVNETGIRLLCGCSSHIPRVVDWLRGRGQFQSVKPASPVRACQYQRLADFSNSASGFHATVRGHAIEHHQHLRDMAGWRGHGRKCNDGNDFEHGSIHRTL